MAMTIEESDKIVEILKADDAKALQDALGARKNILLGRFPLLSLCYLYRSRRILRTFGAAMQQGTVLEAPESPLAYRDFAAVAGRALRLFAGASSRVVSPAYMLAVTGQWHKLCRNFAAWGLEDEEKETLLAVLRLRYEVEGRYDNGALILPSKPIALDRKPWIVLAIVSALVLVLLAAVVLAVGSPYAGRLVLQNGATRTYTLTRDLTLSGNVETSAISLDGKGHTLVVEASDRPVIGVFRGELRDCTLRIVGEDIAVSQAYAVFCLDNYGTFQNVRVEIQTAQEVWTVSIGSIPQKTVTQEDGTEVLENDECRFGILCVNNYGTIRDCSTVGKVNVVGDGAVNAEIGGVAAFNYGTIENVTTYLAFTGDTADLGGVAFCNEQEGIIRGCRLDATASVVQTTSQYNWNPITGGVVALNNGTIEDVYVYANVGSLKSDVVFPDEISSDVSRWPIATCGGVAAYNHGTIRHCLLASTVKAGSDSDMAIWANGVNACVGAFAGENVDGEETKAVLEGNIALVGAVVQGSGYSNNVGGLCGFNMGSILSNVFMGQLSVSGNIGTLAGAMSGSVEVFGDTVCDNHTLSLQAPVDYGFFQDYVPVPAIGVFLPTEEGYTRSAVYAEQVEGIEAHNAPEEIQALEVYWYEE